MSATSLQPLPSHEFFESLLVRPSTIEPTLPDKVAPLVIVYFTANWCGACKRLDLPALMNVRPDAAWYKCDVDLNNYTPGYCGVRSIPSFQAVVKGQAVPLFGSSSNQDVARWLNSLPATK